MSKVRGPVCDEVSAKIADEWIFTSKSNGRHPRQVDDLGARGRDVLRRHSHSRVATADVSARSLVIAADRATAVRARIFLMSFVADAASAFETQSANILHGCHAVSYFLALKKTCTHDRQKRKRTFFRATGSAFTLHSGRAVAR